MFFGVRKKAKSSWINYRLLVFLTSFYVVSQSSLGQVPPPRDSGRVAYIPAPESESDMRASYPIALLELCSDYHNNSIVFRPSKLKSQQARNILRVEQRQNLDILWTVGTQERQQSLRAIPIPIDRGLIGWRLLLIRAQDQKLFERVTSIDTLKPLIGGQGHDWPDLTILKNNNLSVATSTRYNGLFKMLQQGHIQYFPRSISEIWGEANTHQGKGFIVEPTLALHYRQGLYFFINQQDEQLYQLLTSCLHAVVANNALTKIFYGFYGADIEKAKLDQRKIIYLNHHDDMKLPSLPNNYWFSPGESLSNLLKTNTNYALSITSSVPIGKISQRSYGQATTP